jgi:RNA polymerase sigma factor (sigma-70 family)
MLTIAPTAELLDTHCDLVLEDPAEPEVVRPSMRAAPPDPAVAAFERYRFTHGEPDFQELMRLWLPVVRVICRRILGGSALTEDAMQETFIKIARHAHTVVGAPGPWVRACAVNASLSLRRSERARRAREQAYAVESLIDDDHHEEAPWEQSLVLACLSELVEQDRQVLVEHFLLERSQTDIAAELGISQVAVHKRVQRALAALRLRVIAAGASDGLAAIAAARAGAHDCAVADPFTWLLMAASSSRRATVLEAMLQPIRALVAAISLADTRSCFYASSVKRSVVGQALWWIGRGAVAIATHLDPRVWFGLRARAR